MAFRYVTPVEQYLLSDAVKVLAGGNLYFYDSGTSNPRATYADADLSAENTNPVILDASGRPNADIWMSGSYRVVLKDASGATLWTRDDVQGPADLPTLAGNEGRALFTDGESLAWRDVSQVPDVTGQSGKVLTNDGETPFWQNPASSGIPALVAGKWLTNDGTDMAWDDLPGAISSGTSFQVGQILVQTGSDTITASGTNTATKDITFPTAFSSTLIVLLSFKTSGVTSVGFIPAASVVNKSAHAFTAIAQVNAHQGGSDHDANIISDVPFDWVAIGVAVA
jgi:hypothetical protein